MSEFLTNPVDVFCKGPDGISRRINCSSSGFITNIKIKEYLLSIGENLAAGYYWDEGELIADDAFADLMFQALNPVFLTGSITTEGDAEIEFYQNTVFSDVGVIDPIVNHNFLSTKVTDSIVSHDPVLTSPGDLKVRQLIIGGQKKDTVGGSDSGDALLILAPGNYLLRVINKSAASARMQLSFNFSLSGPEQDYEL